MLSHYDIGNASYRRVLRESAKRYGVQFNDEYFENIEKKCVPAGIGCNGLWCVRVGKIAQNYNKSASTLSAMESTRPFDVFQRSRLAREMRSLMKKKNANKLYGKRLGQEYKRLERITERSMPMKYDPAYAMMRIINAITMEELSHALGGFEHKGKDDIGGDFEAFALSKFFYDITGKRQSGRIIETV